MFPLNFMFFCSLIEELCTKEENDKTSSNFNFGHECSIFLFLWNSLNMSANLDCEVKLVIDNILF